MSEYGINDIESLSFREGIRQRIQMYLGSNDMAGVYAGIQEIISNSVDEYYMGYGDEIRVSLNGNEVTVELVTKLSLSSFLQTDIVNVGGA